MPILEPPPLAATPPRRRRPLVFRHIPIAGERPNGRFVRAWCGARIRVDEPRDRPVCVECDRLQTVFDNLKLV
jgi:hypothetical protein